MIKVLVAIDTDCDHCNRRSNDLVTNPVLQVEDTNSGMFILLHLKCLIERIRATLT